MNGESPNVFVRNENKCTDDDKCDLTCVTSQSLGGSPCFGISLSNDKLNQETGINASLISNVSVDPRSTDPKSLSKQSVSIKVYYTNEKKTCNCTKSHCLKLYCECFARGQSCIGCSCSNCMNNIDFEEDRTRAIQQTLDKNPSAFHPKIGCVVKKHSRGCNCKRSSCLKNYCECFEAKIFCSDLCKCKGCRNCSDSARLKSAENSYHYQDSKPTINGFDAYITPGLIEVVCSCMLSQLILSESGVNQEAIILVEFAKFLEHVLKSMTTQLKNEQLNYSYCVETPSIGNTTVSHLSTKTVPYLTSTSYSDGITNDTGTETPDEQSNLFGRSNECTISDQTQSKCHMISEMNCCYSSNIPGSSFPSQYELIHPSFRSLLSSSEEAETQCVYRSCGIPFSSESTVPPSDYRFSTPPHLTSVEPLDSTTQNGNMIAEILPYEQTLLGSVSADNYSSEADLAVAAISGEMSKSSNSECNNIYEFHGCGPDYCSNYTSLRNQLDFTLQ